MDTSSHHPSFSPFSSASSDHSSHPPGWERFLPSHPLRVLLVEEDVATRHIVSALLSKCGYEVIPAADGLTAWNLLENSSEKKFDLILADAFLPVIPGTDLLTKIMSHDSHKDIPVIMMSSQDSLDVVFRCLLRGAKDFLVKPVRKNELQNLWQHVWRKNRESSRSANGGYVQGKKRKATAMSSSVDVSSDGFSISGGISAENGLPNGRAAQVVNSELLQPQTDEDPRGGVIIDQEVLECEVGSQTSLEQKENSLSNVDYEEDPERSAKAVDSFEARTEHFISNGAQPTLENEVSFARLHEPLPESEIALRTFAKGHLQPNLTGKHSVRQSHCSAFSKYVSCTTEKSVARTVSLPNDHNSYANGNKVDGHSGTSTLHFPQAIHFCHAGQQRTALASIASSSNENARHSVQEKFCSPSLNSTTNGGSSSNTNAQLHGSDNGECGVGDSQSMVQHNVHHNHHRLIKTDHVGSNQQNANQLQSSSAADYVSIVERNTTSHEMPGYMMASSGESNFGDEHQMGRSVNYAGSGSCGPTAGADENSIAECSRPTNEEVEQIKANDYRIAIRQAALNKFRQKRKVRCFEKKVRYQTRKKLAEQRPRVKGQFVRQAVYDAVAAVKPDR